MSYPRIKTIKLPPGWSWAGADAGLVDADFLAQYLQIIFHVRWRVSLQAFTTDK